MQRKKIGATKTLCVEFILLLWERNDRENTNNLRQRQVHAGFSDEESKVTLTLYLKIIIFSSCDSQGCGPDVQYRDMIDYLLLYWLLTSDPQMLLHTLLDLGTWGIEDHLQLTHLALRHHQGALTVAAVR